MKRFRLQVVRGHVQRKHWIGYRIRQEGWIAAAGALYVGKDTFPVGWARGRLVL